MKKNSTIIVLLLLAIAGFSQLKIAVSIVPEKFFIERVAGDNAYVFELIPPGSSPANYAPTTRELIEFSDSDVYFSIGVPTEKSNILPKITENAPDVEIVDLSEYVSKFYEPRFFAPGKRDPHIWLSPKRMIAAVDKIESKLSEIDPENATVFSANAKALKDELIELDAELKETFENLKYNGFFLYHPAFGYFADDYGLNMYALEKDGKQATPQRIAELVDLAEANHVKIIFYQQEIDSAQVQSFASEIGGKALQISPLAYDYINNLKKIGETFEYILNNE